jgi:molybdopterin synthase sulfur carrier subunit
MIKIFYFAFLRERAGMSEEDVALPKNVTDVKSLMEWIKGRGGGFADAMADPSVVRVAVNQEYVQQDAPVKAGDEVAFFPPVTGG